MSSYFYSGADHDSNSNYKENITLKYINLTPHTINLVAPHTPSQIEADDLGDYLEESFLPEGEVVRVETFKGAAFDFDKQHAPFGHRLPVAKTTYGDIEGLPAPKQGFIFIVSTLVQVALRAKNISRNDLISPDTGPDSVVRDPEGRILGVKRFQIL